MLFSENLKFIKIAIKECSANIEYIKRNEYGNKQSETPPMHAQKLKEAKTGDAAKQAQKIIECLLKSGEKK